MKKTVLASILICLVVLGWSQIRSLPSKTFEKASKFQEISNADRAWDFEVDFQDTTILGDFIFENVDSLSDHPDITGINIGFSGQPWIVLHFQNEQNNWLASNSHFDPPGQADRWVIMPNVVVDTNAVMRWKARSVSLDQPITTNESYEIHLYSGEATGYEDFTNAAIYSVTAEDTVWTHHEIDLTAYAGDTVSLAFRHTSDNQYILAIDDILVGEAPVTQGLFTGDFENISDFNLDLSPWITHDVDGFATYGISGIDYVNKNQPMAFMAFNPYTTSPALTNALPDSTGGLKYGACFAAADINGGANDDWLVSPEVIIGGPAEIRFLAKAFSLNYSPERFKVLVSTTGSDPADFTNTITPLPYVQITDTAWQQYSYDLSDWENQSVHVAINCVSEDAFIFCIDNIEIDTIGTVGIAEPIGSSFGVYPNPANEKINLQDVSGSELTLFNSLGKVVFRKDNTLHSISIDVSALPVGVYYLRVEKGSTSETTPLVIAR